MACKAWTEKLDAYFDGELPADEARAVDEHLRQCTTCAADGLRRLQQKRAVQIAARRFVPNPAFRARIEKSVSSRTRTFRNWRWFPVLATAAAAVALIGASLLVSVRQNSSREQLVSELVDQHVATLASANPVDVVSTDRHTVKPWFQGRIPFTFNLPELEGSPFVLVGGRVTYIRQSPGAELMFRIRQHQMSVFIFQDPQDTDKRETALSRLSFGVRTWRNHGLRYFLVGDAGAQDLDQLRDLIKAAG